MILRIGTDFWPRDFAEQGGALTRSRDGNRIEGNWKEFKGTVKETWGKLTDDGLDKIAGKREQLEGKIQQRYGVGKDLAQKDIDDWLNKMQ